MALTLFIQRKKAGLTLKDAALRAGISPSKLRKIECGLKDPRGALIPTLLQIYESNMNVQLLFCMSSSHLFMFIRLFINAAIKS